MKSIPCFSDGELALGDARARAKMFGRTYYVLKSYYSNEHCVVDSDQLHETKAEGFGVLWTVQTRDAKQ